MINWNIFEVKDLNDTISKKLEDKDFFTDTLFELVFSIKYCLSFILNHTDLTLLES